VPGGHHFLFPVMFLGIVGINVAKSTQQYQEYLWMPSLLTILSGGVILSIVLFGLSEGLNRFY
jgi:hypothetical protein